MWEHETQVVVSRAAELQRPDSLEALSEALAARAVGIGWLPADSHDHVPTPHRSAVFGESATALTSGPFSDGRKVETDAEGRPVRVFTEGGLDLLEWAEDRVWFVEVRYARLRSLQLVVLQDGRPARSTSWRRGDDPGSAYLEPELYVSDAHGRPRWAVRVFPRDDQWGAAGTRFTDDASGRLLRAEHVVLQGSFDAPSLAAAFELAAGELDERGVAGELWDARTQRREASRPHGPPAPETLAEPLARALVLAAQDASTTLEGKAAGLVVVVHLQQGRLIEAALMSSSWMERARATRADPARVAQNALLGGPQNRPLDVRDHLEETVLAEARAVMQSRDLDTSDGAPWDLGVALTRAVMPALEAAFDHPIALLVEAIGGRRSADLFGEPTPPFELVREALGDLAAEDFRDPVRATECKPSQGSCLSVRRGQIRRAGRPWRPAALHGSGGSDDAAGGPGADAARGRAGRGGCFLGSAADTNAGSRDASGWCPAAGAGRALARHPRRAAADASRHHRVGGAA